ncbi:Myosin-X [Dactylellina cionopaga]|nr:Myosin-X [Dactylellina cionopaga]
MAAPGNQPQASLPSLPAHVQSDTHLTAHLASRFHLSLPTASISSHALISLNTYTSATVAGVECEKLAERLYNRLCHRAENQAVLFLGESGSGKTTLRSHLLASLLSFSSTPLSNKISFASFLFDTLTTTKSSTTPTASKAGLFLELQYDNTSSTLIGGKLLDHRLERSRISHVPTGERNFHVLYYLLSGTSQAEKEHLGLNIGVASGQGNRNSVNVGKRWRYLGHPSQLKVGINDADGFDHFKTALRKLEFPRGEIAEICQILATILHIGQLEFQTTHTGRGLGDDSGPTDGGEDTVVVKNKDALNVIATFLGVSGDALEMSFGYKTKTIQKERVTIMLDAKGARANADDLARTLYSLLVAWVVESANEKLCAVEDTVANTISIVDFPGFAQATAANGASHLDQLLNNAATEALYGFTLQHFFERSAEMLDSEEVAVPATSYFDNGDAVKALLKQGNGLLAILDDQTRRGRSDAQFFESVKKRFEGKNPAVETIPATTVPLPTNNTSVSFRGAFTIRHYAGEVEYPVYGLLEDNGEVISGDIMQLIQTTTSNFVAELFSSKAINTQHHPQEKSAIVQAQLSSKPLRQPSVVRKKGTRPVLKGKESPTLPDIDVEEAGSKISNQQGAAGQFLSGLDTITKALNNLNTNPYFVFCLKPNDRRIANQFDSKCVRTQVRILGIAEITQRVKNADFSVFMPFGEFLGLTSTETSIVGSEREKTEMVLDEKRWPSNEARCGSTGVFLSEACWAEVANIVPGTFMQSGPGVDRKLSTPGDEGSPFGDSKSHLIDNQGLGSHIYGKGTYLGAKHDADGRSDAGASAFNQGDMFKHFDTREQMAEKGAAAREEEIDEVVVSGSRKRWLFVVWALTFYVPDFFLTRLGRMKRKDVRVAWREKLAINVLIWLSCAFVIFFIIEFPRLICPKQDIYSQDELRTHYYEKGKKTTDVLTAIRGEVFDLSSFSTVHYPPIVKPEQLLNYGGQDATKIFPVQVSALCRGRDGKGVNPYIVIDAVNVNSTTYDRNAVYHDFRYSTSPDDVRPDWYYELLLRLRANYKKGFVGYSAQYVSTLGKKQRQIAIIGDDVFDLTNYLSGGRPYLSIPDGVDSPAPGDYDLNILDNNVVSLFQDRAGEDVTKYWDALKLDPVARSSQRSCLRYLYFVGKVDSRNSPVCLFSNYIILAITIILVSVIGFKFLAALQFTRKNLPEQLDKFVICQVPAYTEDEDSLRRAIDSLARMKYDDKRKLLVVVCDGMIIGQGNDRPTPRIVLDILGWTGQEPEALSFESLGEGLKQHNMGKIYAGLYDTLGHIVPFLVVVKVGKPSEVSKPGNRGKRDSQMIIMRFLNRVHYNLAMSPLELEMYHQIRNIIGVNPTFYEYLLGIDADTEVAPDSCTRMVSTFINDTKTIAVCGETGLTNAKATFITMMQVYEYFISHNLAKAFESLFGSVTCLPGCFSMYRIRTAETGKPLFVSKEVVETYANIRVDTLHLKNLLHLGEDRYLTTLLIKFHPRFKTKFIMSAKAWTIAPDSWSVFLSQRRRWINSTIHNLVELIPLSQLCGFCCFSMRFVVFLDLLSTIIGPATVGYLCYLIYTVASSPQISSQYVMAFLLLAAVYGLQVIIFIVRRKWEMIGWMIIYILAIPVFSFGLPLYSFWHMDDFSWGNTRVVTGDAGKKVIISDEGKFDPSMIPRKKWEEYQAELWEAHTSQDARSEYSGISYGTKPAASEYGGVAASHYEIPLPRYTNNGSRFSLAPSELLGAGGQQGMRETREGVELISMELPGDDAILAEIRDILKTADLMTVTKKSIKTELERRFGLSLDAKKAYINSATEAILSGNL